MAADLYQGPSRLSAQLARYSAADFLLYGLHGGQPMSRSNRDPAGSIAAAAAALLSCAASISLPTSAAAQAPANQPVIYLNQAWSQDDREWYYHFSQGSAILSYDIFLNLEVAAGQELFRSNANSERYGLIAEPQRSKYNPDG